MLIVLTLLAIAILVAGVVQWRAAESLARYIEQHPDAYGGD